MCLVSNKTNAKVPVDPSYIVCYNIIGYNIVYLPCIYRIYFRLSYSYRCRCSCRFPLPFVLVRKCFIFPLLLLVSLVSHFDMQTEKRPIRIAEWKKNQQRNARKYQGNSNNEEFEQNIGIVCFIVTERHTMAHELKPNSNRIVLRPTYMCMVIVQMLSIHHYCAGPKHLRPYFIFYAQNERLL